MIGLLQKITQRPKDKNIRIGKIIFALILLITLYYNLIYQGDSIESSILGMTLDQSTRLYTKYSFLLLGIIPLITGLFDLNLLKSSHTRYLQIIYSILLMFIASIIIEGPNLDSDTIIMLLGVVTLITGVTGKAITKKGLRAGQKITKIRV